MLTRENIELNLPKTINIADRPPLLGGLVKAIPVHEFEIQAHFKWCETFLPSAKTLPNIGNFSNLTKDASCKIFQDIEKNFQRMAICYMNEKVRYGVFATKDIPEDSYVTFYAGEICYENEAREIVDNHTSCCDYFMQAKISYKIAKHAEVLRNGVINSEYFGNISRFFQHLPSQYVVNSINELTHIDNYQFNNNEDCNNVAIANLQVETYSFKGFPLVLLVTSRMINKGEILGYDYGNQYWSGSDIMGITPNLFHINGDVINPHLYSMKNIFVTLQIDKLNIQFTIDRNFILASKEEGLVEINPGFAISLKETLFEPITKTPNTLFFRIECSSQLRFFQSKKEVVTKKLNEMTCNFNLPGFDFDESSNTAILHLTMSEENKNIINDIATQLTKYDMEVKINVSTNNNLLSLFVHNPTARQLINLKQLEKTAGFHSFSERGLMT